MARLSVATDDLFPPESRVGRALALLDQVEEVSPELARWIRADPVTRGPQPLCDARTLELLDEARSLYAGPEE